MQQYVDQIIQALGINTVLWEAMRAKTKVVFQHQMGDPNDGIGRTWRHINEARSGMDYGWEWKTSMEPVRGGTN